MLTEATLEFHTPTQVVFSTFGLEPPGFLFLHGSIPTCGNSPINSIGMTKRFCLSNTTGKRLVKRISHTSSRYDVLFHFTLKQPRLTFNISWNGYVVLIKFPLLQWNQYMDKDHRDSYYFNWPIYFP
uniref:Uncharacterized protein n=1 Tax=Cucumis melo TaxID=3656 RepID=A0A9I9CW59_CUCME